MKQWLGMVSLLLAVLMAGCAQETALPAVRANTVVAERQSSGQQQTVEARVQQLSDRLTQIERAQAATRRDMAQVTAMLDEVRVQLQRLQGAIEETDRQAQRGTTEGVSATRLSNMDTRLRALTKQLAGASQ